MPNGSLLRRYESGEVHVPMIVLHVLVSYLEYYFAIVRPLIIRVQIARWTPLG